MLPMPLAVFSMVLRIIVAAPLALLSANQDSRVAAQMRSELQTAPAALSHRRSARGTMPQELMLHRSDIPITPAALSHRHQDMEIAHQAIIVPRWAGIIMCVR
jgi:hypothetical protein